METLSNPTIIKGEILRFFFGVVIVVATKFEFGYHHCVWATPATSKFIPAIVWWDKPFSQIRSEHLLPQYTF
jgi:hypothetical protein